MGVSFEDKSGQPRSEEDLIEAREAIKKAFIQGPVNPIMIHYGVVIDAINELIEYRRIIKLMDEKLKK